jgi:hypothetical protein
MTTTHFFNLCRLGFPSLLRGVLSKISANHVEIRAQNYFGIAQEGLLTDHAV